MRDDDFFLSKRERDHLAELLATTIPGLVDDLAITITKQDRIGRPELTRHRRTKRPGSRPPVNLEAAGAADELRSALATAIRFICEERAIEWWPLDSVAPGYIGPLRAGWRRLPEGYQATILDLTAWLRKHLISLALSAGADDVYFEIDRAAAAARRAVDHPVITEHYVGTCPGCERDLYARRSETRYNCRCGTSVTKLSQDDRINAELEGRNYTAQELVAIVRDRLGVHVKVKAIYDLEYRKIDPVQVRGWRSNMSGRQVKMYRAGDVLNALRERVVAHRN